MSSGANTGRQFILNYFAREWKVRRLQKMWTALPNERNLNQVIVLYQFNDEIVTEQFRGLQLLFMLELHEEHPYKPPSLIALTPNGRMRPGERICINGLTAWHPESWNVITTLDSIVERFASAFIDMEQVTTGAGFEYETVERVKKYAMDSVEWNKKNYPDIVCQFEEQCSDVDIGAAVPESPRKGARPPIEKVSIPDYVPPVGEDGEIVYEYSDGEDEEGAGALN